MALSETAGMKSQPRPQPAVLEDDDTSACKHAAGEARLGWLVAVDNAAQAWVAFDNSGRVTSAKLTAALTQAELEDLIATRAPVIVRWEAGAAEVVAVAGKAAARVLEADVDGERVQLTGHKEVVIACGKASITLRANGRVIIRGTQVESYSEGTNRIKGGQVRIN